MGLFNRLFGKKRQEEKSTTDSIEETAEQVSRTRKASTVGRNC